MAKSHRLALCLGVLVLVAVPGCGGTGDGASRPTAAVARRTSDTGSVVDTTLCDGYQANAGVVGSTINLGTSLPTSGSLSVYGDLARGMEAYFRLADETGGVAGHSVHLVVRDDAYVAARTRDNIRRLVEDDHVFAVTGVFGTSNNLEARGLLGDRCVPHLMAGSGSSDLAQPDRDPWVIPGFAPPWVEMRLLADWIADARPTATVAVLHEEGDLGLSYLDSLRNLVKGTRVRIVEEAAYDPAGSDDIQTQVARLGRSRAEVFVVAGSGRFCPAALSLMPAGWSPDTYVATGCAQRFLLGAAGARANGVITMQSSLDPADPALADDPRVRAYVAATRAAGIDETVLRDGLPVMGWNLAALTAAVLQRAPALERGPVMETAYHLDIGGRSGGGTPPGLLLDGIRIHTAGRADPWPIEGGRLVRRSGEGWEELVAVRDYDGRSPLGSGG